MASWCADLGGVVAGNKTSGGVYVTNPGKANREEAEGMRRVCWPPH